MANNRGKQFETKFKQDFIDSLGGPEQCSIDRLYDPTGGFIGIANISDFIGYKQPNIMYLECNNTETSETLQELENKKREKNEHDKLIKKIGIPGVRAGVIL